MKDVHQAEWDGDVEDRADDLAPDGECSSGASAPADLDVCERQRDEGEADQGDPGVEDQVVAFQGAIGDATRNEGGEHHDEAGGDEGDAPGLRLQQALLKGLERWTRGLWVGHGAHSGVWMGAWEDDGRRAAWVQNRSGGEGHAGNRCVFGGEAVIILA